MPLKPTPEQFQKGGGGSKPLHHAGFLRKPPSLYADSLGIMNGRLFHVDARWWVPLKWACDLSGIFYCKQGSVTASYPGSASWLGTDIQLVSLDPPLPSLTHHSAT